MNHIIESQQFTRKRIQEIFAIADALAKSYTRPLKNKIMASLFYEPSTRTRFSFESAMMRLGGNVITTENARDFSSAAKGETLEDTIRTVHTYADIIVLRHFQEGAARRAAAVSGVPIINAGDGAGQHPTQAILDLYTIYKELGRIDGIHIAFVGDLKYGRTVRSLAYLLGKYKNVTMFFVSPKRLKIRNDIKQYLRRHRVVYRETSDLDRVLSDLDVLYQTRIQKERFPHIQEYNKYKGHYIITRRDADRMKPTSIIMHPFPRVDEILPEVDTSSKVVYFKQAKYGLITRMALLYLLLCKKQRR
ncbi:MAG TPA: aspartate carbamoyltransferase [Candidatus Paceibacterota bacterium]